MSFASVGMLFDNFRIAVYEFLETIIAPMMQAWQSVMELLREIPNMETCMFQKKEAELKLFKGLEVTWLMKVIWPKIRLI